MNYNFCVLDVMAWERRIVISHARAEPLLVESDHCITGADSEAKTIHSIDGFGYLLL